MFQNATLKEEILIQAFETYLKVIGSYHVPYSFVEIVHGLNRRGVGFAAWSSLLSH
jgi:hypothetical protein